MASSLIRLNAPTTTGQALYFDTSTRRLFATPLGVDPPTGNTPPIVTDLVEIDPASVIAVGSAEPLKAPVTTTPAKRKKKKLAPSPFKPSNRSTTGSYDGGASRPLKVVLYN